MEVAYLAWKETPVWKSVHFGGQGPSVYFLVQLDSQSTPALAVPLAVDI